MIKIIICTVFFFTIRLIGQTKENNFVSMLNKADSCITSGDKEKAYYYITRYAGLALRDSSEKMKVEDINPLITRMDIKSTAFISGKFSPDFLDWFIFSTYYMWGVPNGFTNEEYNSTILTQSWDNNYEASIIGKPVIEAWSIVGKGNGEINNAYLHLIDNKKPPRIVVGKINEPDKEPCVYELPNNDLYYHYFWMPILKDVDNDGKTELIVRYDVVRGDGFFQECNVFSITDTSLVLLDSIKGDPEGIAWYKGDNIFQTGASIPSSSDLGHLEFDLFEIKDYKLLNGKFKMIKKEKPVTNILWTDEFKKYFYEN